MDEDSENPRPSTSGSAVARRRLFVAGGVAVLVALGAGTVAFTGRPGGGRVGPSELVKTLDAGQAQTYHARYTMTSASGRSELELWRSPPRFRQRFEASVDGLAGRTDILVLGPDVTICTQAAETLWSCTPTPNVAPTDVDPLRVASQELAGTNLVRRSTSISGRDAQCFTMRRSGGGGEVCVTPEGIPLRVAAAGLRIELVELTPSVDAAAFQPPVPSVP